MLNLFTYLHTFKENREEYQIRFRKSATGAQIAKFLARSSPHSFFALKNSEGINIDGDNTFTGPTTFYVTQHIQITNHDRIL